MGGEYIEIHMEGKTLKQRDIFVYLDGAICEGGNSDTGISRRIIAVVNTWRPFKGDGKEAHIA